MTSGRSTMWAGRALSALVVLVLLADAGVSLLAPQKLSAAMAETGFAIGQASAIGIILLISVSLYAVPATASLGAILITAFLGGAICTHFRIGERLSPPQIVCLVLGTMTWAGLYLRDTRYRALLPFRT